MATVTIGLPVYNGADYLDEAMASLCAQTHMDLQILVSDNASTDETADILARWAARDSRVQVYRQPENIGAWGNFLWLAQNAAGEFLSFAAHDDRWSPNYISSLCLELQGRPLIHLAVPSVVLFKMGEGEKPALGDTDCSSVSSLLRTVNVGALYGLYKRETLLRLITSNTFPHTWAVDFSILLPLIFAKSIVTAPDAIYYKRETPLSDERYRPRTARDQYILYRDFYREVARALRSSPLSKLQIFFLTADIYHYMKHAGKLRRIAKTWLKETLRLSPASA